MTRITDYIRVWTTDDNNCSHVKFAILSLLHKVSLFSEYTHTHTVLRGRSNWIRNTHRMVKQMWQMLKIAKSG